MHGRSLRRWRAVHKWTSLVCTLNLFILCLTGLPLIFADELEGAANATVPASGRTASLDHVVSRSGVRPAFVRIAEQEGRIYVGPVGGGRPLLFDARSGLPLNGHAPKGRGAIDIMLALHAEVLAGLAGRLFIAATGLCALVSVVSGIRLYAPFAGGRPFGDVRTGRRVRVGWLDRHNLLGIAAAAWLLIVTATGVMNAIEHPLFALWRGQVGRALPPTTGTSYIGPDAALATARRHVPDMRFETIIFPGDAPGIRGYFLVWGEGSTSLTAKLAAPVAVNAVDGQAAGTGAVPMPWYLRLLDLSRPLHFGDYGGLPLKILWALLDVVTIVVLGSGLYLWIARHRRERAAAARQVLHGASPAMEPVE